ncbi:MAG TPA: NADH-quinone oxidoreductase subunit NuoG [Chloroflexota bacterium]|nr:NADH-quinone oxidoreductase subunit NuoG [Chloroflexota bacterium]
MENTVKVTINGHEYVVPKGMILVDAAKLVGIEIPIFCYHPKMKPVGACRMCLVEIERAPKLQTACTTPVADGMIIHTKSPKAVAGQNATIEFLLANHPLDCPICDKGGECPLQDNSFGFGRGVSRLADMKRHFVKPIPLSDKILLDRERCIMCYRCVRFTREIAGDETLTVLERGSWSQIGVLDGHTFDSPFSGNTIEICPVGALTSSLYRFRARPWDIDVKTEPTVCSLCPVGCNVDLTVRNNEIKRVLARENNAVDDGWLCDRGRFTYQFVASGERLTQPLIRRNGALQPATWDEAIVEIRDRLQETLVKRGPKAVAALASPRGTNEENYLLQKLMRTVIGSNNIDYGVRRHPAYLPFGYDAATGSIAGFERANVIVLANVNPIQEQPVLDLRLKKAAGKGAKLVVIGPEQIDLVNYAALWLKVDSSQVTKVVTALVASIVQDNLVKSEFIAGRVSGADEVTTSAQAIDVAQVANETGLSVDQIKQAAKLWAEAGNASALFRRSGASAGLAEALTDLALLTGQIGRAGAGLYPLLRGGNEQGSIDVGAMPDRLPGQRSIGDADARDRLASIWGKPLPSEPGIAGADFWSAVENGQLSAMYIVNHNPSGPGGSSPKQAQAALSKLDFLVVQDLFLTETAQQAHVVLPGAAWSEKDGTYTNFERRVQVLKVATNPPGEARPDWQIIRDIGSALGGDFDYQASTDVLSELAVAAPIYRGITSARLGAVGLQWPRVHATGAGTESLFAIDDGTKLSCPPLPLGNESTVRG